MENKFKLYNNITGWLVWLFATWVYVSTIEPSASFWDCGEFIASGYKLQVGHPPGAPLWLMLARVFSLFTSDVEQVAAMVNTFSALCSSFSILFLFWTITAMAKKMAGKTIESFGSLIAVLGSGLIGSLAYTFSDSFWFSAVEGEVYAASSLATALVFWLLVKWEANADKKYADRYLILVAYVMGLSIGVHILNLLAIPALVYIYYFKRFETSTKGIIMAGLLSLLMLGVIQTGIISYMVQKAADFEILFTNSFGLPFDSGMWVYFVLVLAMIVAGIWYSTKKKLPNFQNAIYAVLVILIGYSSFAMIVIRSAADPPMDENNPENIVNLLPYLNREQYGDRPLLYGHTFNSELDHKTPYTDGTPVYYQGKNKKGEDEYLIADERKKTKPNYASKTKMLFPRMYSSQSHHKSAYRAWSDFEGKKVKVKTQTARGVRKKKVKIPTFGENMQFFFDYQINFMYWRYFMWNFAGRQNDIQGHGLNEGRVLKGNWISGINAIDDEHVGTQADLPESLKNNVGRNTFFMLPLILGLIGMLYQFSKNWKDGLVVMLLFLLTGLAIVVYLNQTPYQPRERDYAYAGSFYAFAIWIGIGVQALFSFMKKREPLEEDEVKFSGMENIEYKLKQWGLFEVAVTVFLLLVFGIVLTVADSKTEGYSMLYIAGVVAAVVGLCLALSKVLQNATAKAVLAIALTAYVPYVMGQQGWDDHDRSDKFTARDFAKNYLATCEPNAIIFTNGDNDTFPLWYVQDVEGYRTDVRVVNLSLLNTDWYIDQMKRKAYESEKVPFSLTQDQYRQGTRDFVLMDKTWAGFHDIKKVMEYVKSESDYNKRRVISGSMESVIPADSVLVPVDAAKVLDNGTVLPQFKDRIPRNMEWELPATSALYKAKLMIMDLLAENDWERPVYFAITVGDDHYMNLEDYFQVEGLAYKLTPVKHPQRGPNEKGWMHVEKVYDNFMNKYQWGNLEKPGVYMGEQVQRMSTNYRHNFSRLANTLIRDYKDSTRAVKVIDRCLEVMPSPKIKHTYISIFLGESYLLAGAKDKGAKLLSEIADQFYEELQWFKAQDKKKRKLLEKEILKSQKVLSDITSMSRQFGLSELAKKMEGYMQTIQK